MKINQQITCKVFGFEITLQIRSSSKTRYTDMPVIDNAKKERELKELDDTFNFAEIKRRAAAMKAELNAA